MIIIYLNCLNSFCTFHLVAHVPEKPSHGEGKEETSQTPREHFPTPMDHCSSDVDVKESNRVGQSRLSACPDDWVNVLEHLRLEVLKW